MKVAILGNIAGVSNEMLIGLRRSGVEADLYVSHSEAETTFDGLTNDDGFDPAWVHYVDPEGDGNAFFLSKVVWIIKKIIYQSIVVLKLLMKYDLIHSNTGSLTFCFLSRVFFIRSKLVPYLAFATGSDIRENAQLYSNYIGRRMRAFFRNSKKTLLLNVDMLSFKNKLGLKSAEFFPFVVNEEKFSSLNHIGKEDKFEGKLLCFMMSNLDFGYTDNGKYRRGLKNNDRFFYALSEFVKVDKNIMVIVLDRGPDRKIIKAIVSNLGLNSYVTFYPLMIQSQRIHFINMADVIIDQFDPGSLGLGAIEVLSIGKPLITYFREDLVDESYGDTPPILNARTVDDIVVRLLEARDPDLRKNLSMRARQWALKHHSRATVIPRLIKLYEGSIAA